MNLYLNYSKAYFLERLRDELIFSIENGDDILQLRQNLDSEYIRLHNIMSDKKQSDASWRASLAEKNCVAEVDSMRRMLIVNGDRETMVKSIRETFGSIDACNYPIRITFFCQEFDLFPSFQSIWDSLNDETVFKRTAVFVWENMKKDATVDAYVKENFNNYHKIGVPAIDVTEYELNLDQPDICFYMKPYYSIRGLPPRLYVEEVNKHTPFTAYISYCLDVQGGKKLFRFFYGMPAFYDMWKIIGYSNFYKEMAAKYGFRRGENVVVIGHPKFDAIFDMIRNREEWIDKQWKKKIAGRPVVLWNSHFSITKGDGVGTFLTWYKLIFDYFKKNKDIVLLWRPHPIFWQTIKKEKSIDQGEFNNLMEELESMDNVIVNRYGDYRYAFAMSDALISDAATFLVEYAATGNPIMYTPKYDGEGVCDPSCIEQLYIGDSEERIIQYLENVRNRIDPMHDARIANFEKDYGHIDGKIGERIRDYLINAMHQQLEADAFKAVHGANGKNGGVSCKKQ